MCSNQCCEGECRNEEKMKWERQRREAENFLGAKHDINTGYKLYDKFHKIYDCMAGVGAIASVLNEIRFDDMMEENSRSTDLCNDVVKYGLIKGVALLADMCQEESCVVMKTLGFRGYEWEIEEWLDKE